MQLYPVFAESYAKYIFIDSEDDFSYLQHTFLMLRGNKMHTKTVRSRMDTRSQFDTI